MITLLLAVLNFIGLPPPEEYLAKEIDVPLVIDGKAEEIWEKAPVISEFCDITGDPEKAPILKTCVRMLWSEEYLYFFAEMEEPKIVANLKNRDDIIWHENDFEIFIDPDGDGENYFEFEFNAANTLFDLFLTRPYSDKRGTFVMHQWNAEGLKSATARTKDGWALEVAIPGSALANGFEIPLKPKNELRIGFSRVEWLRPEKEENWTWGPTGKVDMHIPSRWGRVTLLPKEFPICVWTRDPTAPFEEWAKRGITAVAVDVGEFDSSKHAEAARRAHEAGLKYHAWVTTLLKHDAPKSWYTVNKLGESAAEESARAYVTYYATLDPHNKAVRAYLKENCARLAQVEDVDYVQLDYIRYADVVLAEALWPKYGVNGEEEPKADACYCADCLADYEKNYASLTWNEYREEILTSLVNEIAAVVHEKGKKLSADVFPAPDSYARRMVRQNWRNWKVDAVFAMNYNDFYLKDVEWIGEMVKEEKLALPKGAELFSGLKLHAANEHEGYVDPEALGITPGEFARACRLSIIGGADGISLFTPNDMTEDHWQIISAGIAKPRGI